MRLGHYAILGIQYIYKICIQQVPNSCWSTIKRVKIVTLYIFTDIVSGGTFDTTDDFANEWRRKIHITSVHEVPPQLFLDIIMCF